MSKWLCERQNYKQEDIVMLLDTNNASGMSVPTKANIVSFSLRRMFEPLES
jgi:hypothetical protein